MDLGKNLFEQAAQMAKLQAEGYRQVREMARNEALEEAAKVCEMGADLVKHPGKLGELGQEIARACAKGIRNLKAQDHPLITGDLAERRRINDEAGR